MTHGMGGDLRYTLRVLRRSPGFTLVAILSLAVGIGSSSAIFGVVRTLLLAPLPVEAPEELAILGWRTEGSPSIHQAGSTSYPAPDGGPSLRSNFNAPIYRELRQAAPAGTRLFAFSFLRGLSVSVGDQPALLAGGTMASGEYFPVLGVPMALGRPLGPGDDSPGAPPVAVLSHTFWLRAFGGDPDIVGRTIRVNSLPVEVVGVTAPGFVGLSIGGFFPQTEVTLPLSLQPLVAEEMGTGGDLSNSDETFWLRIMARIPDGTSRTAVEAALSPAFLGVPSPILEDPEHRPSLHLVAGAQGAQPIGTQTARLLYLLLAVVGMVLLIACVNLASLMYARGVARQREMAVRRAMGGGRARLTRQLLVESLVLAGAGTAAGMGLALVGQGFLQRLVESSLGIWTTGQDVVGTGLDPVVLFAGVGLGLLATVLFGLFPAARLTGLDPMAWLRHRAAGSATPKLTVGRVLIALQIAVSIPLVVGAALFLRTASNLGSVELGFDPEGIVAFQLNPGYTERSPEEYPQLYQEAMAALEAIPGVRSATLLENALMSGIISNGSATVDGERVMVHFNAAGPGLFETLGMPVLEGRAVGIQDGPDAPPVAVVNRTAVRELFGGASPIGRTIGRGSREVEIVGVVGDTPYRSARDDVPPILYESALQRSGYNGHHLVLRIDGPSGPLEPVIREAIHRVDPALPVPELRSQADIMARTTARERVFTHLLTLFGGFALLLASIGLHGVTSYAVTRRTREIGVRVAVGARPGQILTLVLKQVVILVGLGLVVGIPAALWASPLAGSLLYGVAPTDPLTVALASLTMLAVAVGAGLLPAVRAARMDVQSTLRME